MHKTVGLSRQKPHLIGNKRWLVAAIAFLASAALPALADIARTVPDQESIDLIAQLDNLNALATDPANSLMSVAAMVQAAGISEIVPPQVLFGRENAVNFPISSATGFEAQRLDMRLALTPLSQAYGIEGNRLVLLAQSQPDLDALVIRSGQVTLNDVRLLLRDNGLQDAANSGPLTLRVPLIVLADASLILGPGDVLELSRADGAFVMNFGHLQMQGATILATEETNEVIRSFRPFVTTADGGTLDLRGARIVGLGFGTSIKFSGFSVLRNILRTADQPSWIEDTEFDDVMSVAVSADTNIVLRGNRFHDMRGSALIVSRTQGANILGNLFYGAMPTNAIRLEDGSAGGTIAGNVVMGGERTGIVVRNDSTAATVAQNIVWNREGGGIALIGSDCAQVRDNLVIENSQKGIEVRQSEQATVTQNTVFSNDSAGIWISGQPEGAQTTISANIVSFNGSGLAGARPELILMDGNDFSLQYQQFLSGDLALQTPVVARNMRGMDPFILTTGGRVDAVPEDDICTDN